MRLIQNELFKLNHALLEAVDDFIEGRQLLRMLQESEHREQNHLLNGVLIEKGEVERSYHFEQSGVKEEHVLVEFRRFDSIF